MTSLSAMRPLVRDLNRGSLVCVSRFAAPLSFSTSSNSRSQSQIRQTFLSIVSPFVVNNGSLTRSNLMRLNLRLFSSSSSLLSSQSSSPRKSEGSDSSSNSNANASVLETSTDDSPSSSESTESTEDASQPLTRAARIRRATAEYGVVVPVFHISLALTSLGFFYVLVSAGVDFDALFALFGVDSNRFAAGVSTFALAYAVHKLFAPVRIGITLAVAPLLVKWMRRNVTPVLTEWARRVKALAKRD